MNGDLIPSYDMLGLPLAPLVLQGLMSLTLAVHWSLIGLAFGGTAVLLGASVRRREDAATLGRALLPHLIAALSLGVTFGIAPLLFVQVLYGHLFYSANILMAPWWLAIVPLVIATHYLLYFARRRARTGRVPAWVAGAAAALLVVLGTILVSNTLLSQTPDA